MTDIYGNESGANTEEFSSADEENLRQLLNVTSDIPYYDDYDELKQFVKILFRPGRAVQARELTQLQTLLQTQIDRFGSHVFKDGSGLQGGGVGVTQCHFFRVDNIQNGTIDDFNGYEVSVSGNTNDNAPTAQVLQVLDTGSSSDPYSILFVQFIGGDGHWTGDETLVSHNPSFGSLTCDVRSTATTDTEIGQIDYQLEGIYTTGEATIISIEEGVYFMNGYFVLAEAQRIPLYSVSDLYETENSYVTGLKSLDSPSGVRLFSNQTSKIGLRLGGEIVTSDDENTLKDPANGFYNYNAPGADRLKIRPELIQLPYRFTAERNTSLVTYGETTKDFIELIRMENGVSVWQKTNPLYNNLGDTLARRTYDESGSYTVRPFEANILNHLRDDSYVIYCDTGTTFNDTDNTGGNVKIGDVLTGDISGARCTVTNVAPYTYSGTDTDPYPNSDTSVTVKMKVFEGGDEVQDGVRLFEEDTLTGDTYTITTTDAIVYVQDADGVYGFGEGGDESKLACQLGPGKAYVFGYEHELLATRNLEVERGRDEDTVVDYNVVANIGNWVNVTWPFETEKFGGWDSDTFNVNEHPEIVFANSNFVSIEFPFEEEDTAEAECIYWGGLKAPEHDELWNSVLFLGADPDGSPAEPCNDGTAGCFGNISNSTVTGLSSTASYKVQSMSGDTSVSGVKNNIKELVFSDLYNEGYDYITVDYIINNWTADNQLGGFTSKPTELEVAACDAVKVYQMENGIVSGNRGGVLAQGIAWRWVPASATGNRRNSRLYVEELYGTFDKEEDTGNTELGTELVGGVVFQGSGNLTSYGSSIKEVKNIEFVQQLTSSTDYNDTLIGTYEVGDRVRQVKIWASQPHYATGTVIAVAQVATGTSSTDCDKLRVWVEVDGSMNDILNRFLPTGDCLGGDECEGQNIYDIGPLVKVLPDGEECMEYEIADQEIMGESLGLVQQIIFRDPFIAESMGDYTFNTEVYQYNPFHAGEHEDAPSGDEADESARDCVSTILSWNVDSEFSNIYVVNTQNSHRREYGAVFQQPYASISGLSPDLARLGGAGISTCSEDGATGFFVDLKETFGGIGDVPNYITAETVKQIKVDVNSSNYIEGKDYIIGDTVWQTLFGEADDPDEFAVGDVVAWEHRDPSDASDTSSSILTIRYRTGHIEGGGGEFSVGGDGEWPARILSTTIPPDPPTDNEDGYPVENAIIVRRILGTGRLRQFYAKDDDEFYAFFYDIKMNSFSDIEGNILSYEFKDSDEFYSKNSIPPSGNSDTIIPASVPQLFRTHPVEGVDTDGRTKVNGTMNRAIFPLPVGSVASSVHKADYRIHKSYPLTFGPSSGSAIATTGSPDVRFVGGTGSSDIVTGIDKEHYLLIDSDGEVIDLSTASITTNNSANASDGNCVITGPTDGSFNGMEATLLATNDVNPQTFDGQAILSSYRKKTLTTGSDTINLNKVDGQWVGEIPASDIKEITAISDSSGKDITSWFDFDNGQSDNLYGWGLVYILPSYIDSSGNPEVALDGSEYEITVSYNYYAHSGEGPLYVDSYTHSSSNIDFDDIPIYISRQTGDVYPLNTCVDCRPIKSSTGSIEFSWIPKAGEAFDASYKYYMGRHDKVILTNTGEFDVIKGLPSLNPIAPSKIDGTMDLYVLKIPPYTFNSDDVSVVYIENKRYTMRDIGALEKRLEALEYYTSLSLLEKTTETLFIDDGEGNDRFKLGTLVDNFNGHDVGDVRNEDYNCSIDRTNNILRPTFVSESISLSGDATHTTDLIETTDGMFHIPFSENTLVYNPVVSTTFKLNPNGVVDWQGKLTVTPSVDDWADQKQPAKVRVNLMGENDNWDSMGADASGTDWNDWQTNWCGLPSEDTQPLPNKQQQSATTSKWATSDNSNTSNTKKTITRTTSTTQQKQTRTGIKAATIPERVTKSLGDRVVDISLNKFIKKQTVEVSAEGMKPNTTVWPYFDEVLVSEYCTQHGVSVATTGIVADSNGKVEGVEFNLPEGKFLCGEKVVKLIDDKNNQQLLATTSAENDFQATGLVKTKTAFSISTRTPNLIKSNINEERSNASITANNRVQTPSTTSINTGLQGGLDSSLYGTGGGRGGDNKPTPAFDSTTGVRYPRRPGSRPCPNLSFTSSNPLNRLYGNNSCTPKRWNDRLGEKTSLGERLKKTGRPSKERDPLAQTFFVSAEEHPDGIYLTSIDLWFASKGTSPLEVQIRPCQWGTPSQTTVLPFGHAIVNSSDVTEMGKVIPTIKDASNATTVTFSTPVHLVSGQEYAFVINSNSSEYELYGSTIGQSDLNTGDIISKQPTAGSLFKTANLMYAGVSDLNSDLMFILHYAEFDTTSSYDMVFTETSDNTDTVYDMFNLNCNIAEHDTAYVNFTLTHTQNQNDAEITDVFVPLAENTNIKLQSPYKVLGSVAEPTLRIKANLLTQNADVSPMLDKEQLSFIAVNNKIDNNNNINITSDSYNGELEPQSYLASTPDYNRSRYITRQVTLEEGFEASNATVLLMQNKPAGTNIQLFIKYQKTGDDRPFDKLRWHPLTQSGDLFNSPDEYTFTETQWQLPEDTTEPFNKYAIKVCLYSGNSSSIPTVKELRAISVL